MLRTQIKGAIIPGFLGISEPLIYGVTLPRMKPFITRLYRRCLRRLFPRSDRVAGPAGGAEYGLWPFWPPVALPLMTSAAGSTPAWRFTPQVWRWPICAASSALCSAAKTSI